MKITILGCGASSGSPVIGQELPSDAKNIRTRASIFIEGKFTNILIDASPDLRMQAIVNRVKRVDAVLFTHCHADHIHGIDDLKSFSFINKLPMNIYSNKASVDELEQRFAYCFDSAPTQSGWLRPYMRSHVIEPLIPFRVGEFDITAFTQTHTRTMNSLGFRIDNFVYSTDVKSFPEESEACLQNMDLWIVDALKNETSPTHSDITQTLGWIEKYKPKQAVLTHLSYQLDYNELKASLPSGIEPAFDGMIVSC